MPVTPTHSVVVQDGGIGALSSPTNLIALIGPTASGTAGDYIVTADPDAVISWGGGGLATDIGAWIAKTTTAAVVIVKTEDTAAGDTAATAVTRVGTSTGTITTTDEAPNDAYDVVVTITKTGTVGTGSFTLSLDGGDSTTAPIAIPSGGAYAVPGADLTLTFVPGAGAVYFEAGDVHTIDCTGPGFSTTAAADACEVLFGLPYLWRGLGVCGTPADAAASAAMAATISSQMAARKAARYWARAYMQAGYGAAEGDADLISAFAAFADGRVGVCAGAVEMQSSVKPGRIYTRPLLMPVLQRIASAPLHEDLGRVKSGSMLGVSAIGRDERLTPGLDAARFITSKTYPGVQGYYITQGNMMAAEGSDYDLHQLGQVIDRACEIVDALGTRLVNDDLATRSDGKIDHNTASAIEDQIQTAVETLMAGSISAADVTLDRSVNLQTTRTIKTKTRVQPRGYAKFIESTIGLTATI